MLEASFLPLFFLLLLLLDSCSLSSEGREREEEPIHSLFLSRARVGNFSDGGIDVGNPVLTALLSPHSLTA